MKKKVRYFESLSRVFKQMFSLSFSALTKAESNFYKLGLDKIYLLKMQLSGGTSCSEIMGNSVIAMGSSLIPIQLICCIL